MSSGEWIYPQTVQQAVCALSEKPSLAVAGGTNVLDLLKLGHEVPERFVDISRLPLDRIVETPDSLLIGAMVSNTALANSETVRLDFRALSEAILAGASQQIRNAASVGGNILQATRCPYFRTTDWPCNRRSPGSGCEAMRAPMHAHAILGTTSHCVATHPSDMAVALLAFDAIIHAQTLGGSITIPLAEFYLAPGTASGHETALPYNALITGIEIRRPSNGQRSGYLKLRGRASYEFATVSVAAALTCRDGRATSASVALGGVAACPWRKKAAEGLLIGSRLDVRMIDRFCDVLLADADVRPETEHKLPLARGAIHRQLSELQRP